MNLLKTVQIARVLAVVLLCVGMAVLGWHVRGNHEATARQEIADALSRCEDDTQLVIQQGQDASAWVAIADQQVQDIQAEKQQLKKQYEDSIRIIMAMLPADAARKIAARYPHR
ncbi:hypothetical protein [Spirosoma sp.]|uniref:hypothetical protein n=1 Tax=Spirosoma sp. TaxID=1899569 RepID=UPI002621DD47|nr:hypothetical protein [Spirosoma sp.]MCX6217595.1 hypothetical protein [Spirosoma sp.]